VDESTVLFPHAELSGNEVMIDYLDDNLRRLKRAMEGISAGCLHWKPDPDGNSIAVTVWHMGRLLDVFLTQHVKGQLSDVECWISCGWAEKTGYDPRGLGRDGWGSVNGYTAQEVVDIPCFSAEQLLGYLDDVAAATRLYVRATPMSELAHGAPGFGGKYTRYQVVSMALMDNVRHMGEVYALQGLYERAQAVK
jgi:hypothetical protein